MPIFEYKCKNCNYTFEILHKSISTIGEIVCPKCNSAEAQKLLSTFSTSGLSSTSASGCEYGNCAVEPSNSNGCSSGMCGLN